MQFTRVPALTGLVLVALAAGDAAPKKFDWQSGRVTSIKAEVSDRDKEWNSYIYRVEAKDRTYTVVLPAPLKAPARTTVKFAVEKDLLYVQDIDGKIRKGCILEPGGPGH